MTDSEDKTNELDPLTREALAWLLRLKSGGVTQADADALQRWRGQSPAHAEAWRQALRLNSLLRDAGGAMADVPVSTVVPFKPARRPWTSRRLVLGGALAAGAGGLMLARPPLALWPSLVEMTADYRTGPGEQKRVELAEGIALELNTRTSIAVRSTREMPRIELIGGEAEIVARRAVSSPLVVLAADGTIRASRANFNVRHDGTSVCVSCLDGAVEVEQSPDTARLQAGRQLTYTAQALGEMVAMDASEVSAWRSGLLIFHDKPLSDVIAEVNRYRAGRILLAGDQIGRRPVNGVFHIDRLDGVIAQLEKLGARATRLPGDIVILN